MKHTLKNHATHFAMLLMALAMAFTFLACEEKDKGAETPKTEAECTEKTGPLQTAEAVFLELYEGDVFVKAGFRLADGNEIWLIYPDDSIVKNLKKGDKVSITYQEKRYLFDQSECRNDDVLKSAKKLPNK